MKKKKLTFSPQLERETYQPAYPIWKVLTFFLLLAGGCVLSFLIFLRPTYSEGEKRNLATFPAFSAAALLDGSYFDDIDTWFSDTFPLREEMVALNGYIRSAYGIQQAVIYEDTSNQFDDDEIPEIPTTVAPSTEQTTTSTTAPTTEATTTEPTESTTDTTDTTTEATESETTTAPTETTTEATTPPTESTAPSTDEPLVQTLGSVLVAGNHAYEYYGFSKSAADVYISAVNRAAQKLEGKATVYDILAPLAMDIVLDDEVRADISSADQKKAQDYIYASMNPAVKTVDAYTLLREHRDEYLYFRTDHHWTATGAYYAYAAFCDKKGVTAPLLTDYETKEFGGYLGTLYSKTGKPAALGNTPDTVVAYLPLSPTTMKYTTTKGKTQNWHVVADVSGWNKSSLYNAFIGGDNPFTEIHNTELKDGSSCVVVKESFGNAFVPFLTSNYETVYVIDYRYYKGGLVEFVTKNNVQDVIFINNMSATRASTLMNHVDNLVEK